MFTVLIRTIILYFLVIFSMRIMGKKQIGQFEPFELAITIMVSELASLPMQDTRIPLIHGIIPIITLLLLQTLLSIFQLKSEKLRGIINGKPSILIKNGKIDINELKYQRYNMNDLMEELRIKGFYDIEDIEYAILETSGELSIIPKSELNPVTKKDMNIQCNQDSLPITLILDGKINYKNLKLIDKDINWLNKNLNKNNINNFEDVFIAILNSKGKIYIQKNKVN
ncbi:uncharacterized membrane protein YcaP (DUF421 family) [Clostridium tetanomorphum]|uniref:DUF421 domain-containing protein n=1 Tax=Clostridium tetanomorphum TaxID=1553 RepID=A0A923ECP8_CLOTT|nr:DUF421 domain-containing protein [Clostridium tetanomorphum]KAJ50433.1 hypothetical protein CTM_18281 [Clostridium tetanomorphum DSM 665]MBC2399441.1 DUF421 domain-containing protein [Clostridium tetanomorphum]MBP1865752.1 uncharacterized membrane protein YcaP (DUF421 family) [Clostridium tetanomorphum]NRS86874.1 uncharacterized membrane protein YcaP (DUF421 family) [Clostridium tetanomorphum]NRZ99370.1 uncharacterized membrane protein YcaP (DUF421 family) [Clostridium tetanomorphum]